MYPIVQLLYLLKTCLNTQIACNIPAFSCQQTHCHCFKTPDINVFNYTFFLLIYIFCFCYDLLFNYACFETKINQMFASPRNKMLDLSVEVKLRCF